MINTNQNMKNIPEMKKYLETRHMGFGFQELSKSVIDKGMCNMCGACISICPRIGINATKPKLNDYDPECSACLKYCPETYFPEGLFKTALFDENTKDDYYLGSYNKAFIATNENSALRASSQNGGIVTSLLIYALEKGLIDGALLTDKDDQWKPIPVIAKTAHEIKKYAGSKYTITPTLKIYRKAIEEHKLKKVGFVGMPCQIRAVRKMQLFSPFPSHFGNFELVIGLFCSSNFSYDLINTYIRKDLQISPAHIRKMDIAHGKFKLYLKDGKTIKVPIKTIIKYKWPSCKYCHDYTAEFADISIGSIGASDDDWNSVLIRTDRGRALINDAINDKRISKRNKIELSKIKKAAIRKKSKNREINQKNLNSLKSFGLSKAALEIYAIIVSTGGITPELLQKMDEKFNRSKFSQEIRKLEAREWIFRENGTLRAHNPERIMKKEISKLRHDLEDQINKIKSGALNYLKDQFLRNNYTNITLEELLDLI
jgi:coenzyme F420 hydrogenase subunit beta